MIYFGIAIVIMIILNVYKELHDDMWNMGKHSYEFEINMINIMVSMLWLIAIPLLITYLVVEHSTKFLVNFIKTKYVKNK